MSAPIVHVWISMRQPFAKASATALFFDAEVKSLNTIVCPFLTLTPDIPRQSLGCLPRGFGIALSPSCIWKIVFSHSLCEYGL